MPRLLPALIFAFGATVSPALYAVDMEEQPGATALDPDYAAGRKAIEARDWNTAIKSFSTAALRSPDNADIQNYLGFANRKIGQLDPALKHYRRALELNPRHRGAHEYIGEAYLMDGKPEMAEQHLLALEKICSQGCEEYTDLAKAMAAYKAAR